MREPIMEAELDALLHASSPYPDSGAEKESDRLITTEPVSAQRATSTRQPRMAAFVAVAVTAGVLVVAGVFISLMSTRPPVTSPPPPSALQPPVSSRYADLNRAPSAKDALPGGTESWKSVDPDSVRFVAVDGDWSIWIASGSEPGQVCLVLYAPTDASTTSATSCGDPSDDVSFDATGPGGEFQLVPDGAVPPRNGTALSENVYRIDSN